jgi:hypothetical protein
VLKMIEKYRFISVENGGVKIDQKLTKNDPL